MAGVTQWRRWAPWRGVLAIAVILLVIVLVPTRTAGLVARAQCRTSSGPLFQTVSCPLYVEHYHGGDPAVIVSVSARPATTTDDPGAYASLGSVTSGFHPGALAIEVLLALVGSVALAALFTYLTRRRTRIPPSGGRRRRRVGSTGAARVRTARVGGGGRAR